MDDIRIGPQGWGSIIRRTAVEPFGEIIVNVNSRGYVEVIRCAQRRGDYRGWYSEVPTGQALEVGNVLLARSGRLPGHAMQALVGDTGVVRVERRARNVSE